jgi:ABC-type antimicrobial peptide transport system permease subunit
LDRTLAVSVPGAVDQIHTMDEILAGQLYPFRALYWLTSAIGGVALLLTLSGIYGVLSYLVSQRTKESGIRVALGASTARVAGLVMRQSLRFTMIGTVLGAIAALGVSRLLAAEAGAFVFNTIDGWAFGLGAALVLAASVCAAYVPSRRAARIEPITTLRYD